MGNLVFQATLGGQVNLVGPNTASTYNINVPSVNGNLVTTGDTGTVTNTMLAGSISNAKLTNSSVTVGSTAISLGSAATTVAGLTLTSPTLTTPALGTPASGVMTNVTSLPAAQITGSQAIPKSTLPTGSVLQVVSATFNTNFSTNSASFVATPITLNITPTSSTSKILVRFAGGQIDIGNGRGQASLTLYRGGTNLSSGSYGFACIFLTGPASFEMQIPAAMEYLDSPATTSSTTYTVYLISNGGGTVYMSTNANAMTITAMEISA
jgi:hypothetical protein